MRWTHSLLGSVALGLLTHCTAFAQTEFKLATIAPEGSAWMAGVRQAADDIKVRTDGRVILKFYTGGVMGSDRKVLRKMRARQLHGGALTSSGLSDRYPDLAVYGMPLMFRDYDEVEYVRERLDATLAGGLADAGLVSFGFATGGFALLMGNEQVFSLAELRGKKAWIPEGDQLSAAAMEALNLSPVVLPITDVLTGLQTGLVEFIATPPVGAVVLQWYTKVKFVTDIPLAYTLGTMVVDSKAFKRISAGDQAIFKESMSRAYAKLDAQARTDNENALAALRSSGLTIATPTPEQEGAWRTAAADSHRQLVDQGIVSAEIFTELVGLLDEYRDSALANTQRTSAQTQ